MILNTRNSIIVCFGQRDIGGGGGLVMNAPLYLQQDWLCLDEPGLFERPVSMETKPQAILPMTEIVPSRTLVCKDGGGASVNDQAEVEASSAPASVEFRFTNLASMDSVIRWLVELRETFKEYLDSGGLMIGDRVYFSYYDSSSVEGRVIAVQGNSPNQKIDVRLENGEETGMIPASLVYKMHSKE